MARLTSALDIKRRPAPTDTPNIRVGAIDYGPEAAGSRAIGDGMSAVGAGINAMVAANTEIDDYETRKKMLDFKLKTEIEHENFKRTMPAGGADFSKSWNERYQEMAKEFVGDGDANIPRSQQAKVGLHLKQHEVMLSERAQRAEIGEKDRFELEGLSGSLEDRKSLVASSPNQLDRFKAEALDMIESNPRLSPAAKAKLRKTYIPGLVEEAYRGRAAQAKSIDEFKAIIDELKPDMRDKGDGGILSPQYIDGIKKSEGFTPKATWDYKQNSNGYGTKAKFPGEVIDQAEAEKRFADEIGKAAKIVDGFAPNIDEGTRAALVSLTFNAGSKWTTSGLGSAIKSGDLDKAREQFLQYNKAGGEMLPGLAERRRSEAQWIGQGGQRTVSDDATPSYDGPHPELTQKQRRHLYNAVKDEQNKAFAGLHAQLKGQLSDDVESVRRTGKGSTTLDADFARKVLNANQMRNWEIQRKEAEYEFSMMDGLERLTMDAIAEKIDRIKPEPGDESFKAHQRATDKAIRFAGDLQKMRSSDPAGAVDAGPLVRVGSRTISADPEVAAVREAKAGPHALMAARLKAQERLGIPPESQSPITKDEAKRLLAPLAGLKGDDLAKPLSELAVQIQKDYREHAPGVMRYIARTLYQDKASQEIVTDEVNKVLKRPGNMILDPRKLKELERIDQTEMLRRGGAAGSAPATSYPRPNAAQIKMLVENPHFAADFARKFGGKITKEVLDAAGAN